MISSNPNYLTKAPPQNTITLEGQSINMNFSQTHSAGNRNVEDEISKAAREKRNRTQRYKHQNNNVSHQKQ